MTSNIISNNLEDTKQIAKQIAKKVKSNFYILLKGDLGAGKTTFTKLLLKELGVKDNVSSPTFVIMNQYETANLKINHVDAYRLNNDSEIEMYLDEFFDSLNIIEWYENINLNFDEIEYLKINISYIADTKRNFEIEEK